MSTTNARAAALAHFFPHSSLPPLRAARAELLLEQIRRRGALFLDGAEYRDLRLDHGWSRSVVDRTIEDLLDCGLIGVAAQAGAVKVWPESELA